MGFVYLLCDGSKDNTFKIGVTRKDIGKRIKQLQTGNSGEIFISTYYETDIPFFVEKHLHLVYKGKKCSGEWFVLEIDDIRQFKAYCKEAESIAVALKDNPYFKAK